MSVIDDLKNQWNQANPVPASLPSYDPSALEELVRTRARQPINRAMQYFWGAFTLQIIVYALFSHVWIRFWGEPRIQWLCLAGLLLYLPFTVVLLKKFKRIARASPSSKQPSDSVQKRIQYQYLNLVSFYRFKKRYEYGLIPISTGLCIFLLFELYVPGGLEHYPTAAAVLYGLTLLSCGWAIHRENRNQFERPIDDLQQLLSEFNQ
ncbi:hypothetical protein LX87_05408 [Larkinella arboricola]|uniref:Uncharacterized protein n=1 Tax=Larkinella arboricola TaxID=643671 RepID=A0A327WIQ4_LARAB|nr:hypothetical protein [Larkinella arboricola]RAJ90864.1 hypothetical protein LX87_05408 [Larkinella arboricola]